MKLENASRLVSLVGVSRFAQQMIGKSDPTNRRHEERLDAMIAAVNGALDCRKGFLKDLSEAVEQREEKI